ncbi:MAG: 4-alpha-glucanotransferase [Pyrinomonadaceae bacterium]
MSFPRASGILLHPTSLPGRFGIGDLGRAAYAFVDFLIESRQSLWQVLPLGPTGYGDSPYQCFSAFAGNTLLISPERLVADELLDAHDISQVPSFPADKVDFGAVITYKNDLLRRAFERFKRAINKSSHSAALASFARREAYWLDDYALYRALKDDQGGAAWNKWQSAYARRDPQALLKARARLSEAIEEQKFFQYVFFKQWSELKTYANERGIKIVGDIPIFVAYDSADVWMNPDQFKLNAGGEPVVVAGVPPDYFSATGQLWGNPIYDWDRMRAEKFAWWVKRVRATLETVDLVRIDHFRGFAACWEVPGQDETAERGRWVNAPGREIFQAIRDELGELPIIAEDLGVITPDVEALRDDFAFPGMRILQFAFGGDPQSQDLPHNYVSNVVVYTGTHDNDTIIGWYTSEVGAGSTRDETQIINERHYCRQYLNTNGREINWDFIRAVFASVADTAIVPLQDVIGLGNAARMNLPASMQGNWEWRCLDDQLTAAMGERLRDLTEIYGRAPQLKKTAEPSE